MSLSLQRRNLTDKSLTLSAGASTILAANNPTRMYLFIQNTSATDMWIKFTTLETGVTVTQGQPSMKLPPNVAFTMESNGCTTEAIWVVNGSNGDVTCKEATE